MKTQRGSPVTDEKYCNTETNLLLHFVSHTDMLTAYSEEFFENYADHIEVMSRNEIRFVMKCGLTFTERIDD